MDAIIKQRVNEILMGKVAMGAGDGGYGTRSGASKAVKTKRKIAKIRRDAIARRKPAKRAPVRRVTRCRAGDDGGIMLGGANRKIVVHRRPLTSEGIRLEKAKCKIEGLKAENKELKQEVKEVVKEVKMLEKEVMAPMIAPSRSAKTWAAFTANCERTRYKSANCKKIKPITPASPAQKKARENFAEMSRAASAVMARFKAQGKPITRQEAVCMVRDNAGKNCAPYRAMAQEELGVMPEMPGEYALVEPEQIAVGQGMRSRRGRYGRGDMGYGTLIY